MVAGFFLAATCALMVSNLDGAELDESDESGSFDAVCAFSLVAAFDDFVEASSSVKRAA